MTKPITEDWDYLGDNPDWPNIRYLWSSSMRYFVKEGRMALLRHNLDYAAMCRRQAVYHWRMIQQKRLIPKP